MEEKEWGGASSWLAKLRPAHETAPKRREQTWKLPTPKSWTPSKSVTTRTTSLGEAAELDASHATRDASNLASSLLFKKRACAAPQSCWGGVEMAETDRFPHVTLQPTKVRVASRGDVVRANSHALAATQLRAPTPTTSRRWDGRSSSNLRPSRPQQWRP